MADEEVADYFLEKEFPDVRELACGQIIEGCWKGEYSYA